MLTNDATRVAPVAPRFGTKARGVRRPLHRQLGSVEDLVLMVVGYRDLRRRN